MNQRITDGVYCENDVPKHAGVVKVNNEIYYAGKQGKLATEHNVVHNAMTNGILKQGP